MAAYIGKLGSSTHVCVYAAALEAFPPRQGSSEQGDMPLSVLVTMGAHTFVDETDYEGFGVELAFRRVIVDIQPIDCTIAREGRYRRTIPTEAFHQAMTANSSSETGLGGEIGAKIAPEAKALAGIFSGFAWVKRAKNQKTETIVNNVAECEIIAPAPPHRWEIGHMVKDAIGNRQGPFGELSGTYFNLPSNDPGAGPEDDHICLLTPGEDGPKEFRAIIELRAKISDCILRTVGPRAMGEAYAITNKTIIEQRLGIKMLQAANRASGRTPPGDEVILACAEMVFTKQRKRRTP